LSREKLNNLIMEASGLLFKDSELFSDISKEILHYKIAEAQKILDNKNSTDEEIKIACDGNGWVMLSGLHGAIELFKQKKCMDIAEVEKKNADAKRKKSITKKDYTKDDEYIFFGKRDFEVIKNNLKNPLIQREWQRIKTLANEYSVSDAKNIAYNYKAWRLLPFNFISMPAAKYIKVEFCLLDGEVNIDKVILEEVGAGSDRIENDDFSGNYQIVSSDKKETFGNLGRQSVNNVISISKNTTISSNNFIHANPKKDYTLKLFIKQQNMLENPFIIRIRFYDENYTPIGEEQYNWNRLTHIRWDYIFELSCADAIEYLLAGNMEYAIKAKNELIYMLYEMKKTGVLHFMEFGTKPFDDGYGTVHMGRAMAGLCMIYDIIRKIPGFITTDENVKIRNGIFFIADYLGQGTRGANKGLEYFDELQDKSQLLLGGNWTTDQFIGLAYFAMTFPEHPLSFIYLQNSKAVIYEHLENLTNDEGIWPESMRYHSAVLQHIIFYAIALKRYDGTDFTLNHKFKMMYEYMLEVQMPQYEYKNNEISHLIFGDDNLGTGKNYFHFNIASKLFRDTDAAFADRLLATWKKAGGHIAFGGLNGWLLPFIMIDFDNVPKDRGGALKSLCYPDFGVAVLRNDAETERDTHVTVICSKNSGAHGHFDLGSFSYFSNKVPISLDPCVVSYFESSLKWYRSSAAHSTLQFNSENVLRGKGLGMIEDRENGIKHFETNSEYDYVILTVNNPNGSGRQTRHIILEKSSNYLVVYDQIEGFCGNTTFNLPLCSGDSKIEGWNIYSKGHFDTDIYTKVILPKQPVISLSKGTIVPGCIPSDTQDYARITGKNNDAFLVVVCPVKHGEKQKNIEFTDDYIIIENKKIKLKSTH